MRATIKYFCFNIYICLDEDALANILDKPEVRDKPVVVIAVAGIIN